VANFADTKTMGEQEEKPLAGVLEESVVAVALSEGGKVAADAAAEAGEIKSLQLRDGHFSDTEDEEEGGSDDDELMSDTEFELMMAEARESYQKLLDEKLYNGPLKRWRIKDYSLDDSEDEEAEHEEEVRVDGANVEAATA
jgi:hypothetical protein